MIWRGKEKWQAVSSTTGYKRSVPWSFSVNGKTVYNPDFNSLRFQEIRNEAGTVRFTMSVKEWIEETGANGLVSKAGRYGGTFAHRDIAFEFGTRISARFKILLIKEFQRLKSEEFSRQQLEWDYQRFLTKVNYRLHTDTIRDHILPKLQTPKNREWLVFADEADLLNMAVFGLTAKQWREANPELARKGNIRDHAEIVHLNVLANLESLNAVLIERNVDKTNASIYWPKPPSVNTNPGPERESKTPG